MKLDVVNPATGATISSFESDTSDTLRAKVAAARAAQPRWAARPLAERCGAIARFAAALAAQKEELAAILTSEVGKPIAQARREITAVADRIDFFLKNAAAARADALVSSAPAGQQPMDEKIAWEPLGVVANISAWNYPYFVGSNVFIPALLMGNTVLYKPSEFSSLTGKRIAEAMWAAGVPRDVFSLVLGGGAIGAELVSSGVNGVFFTGSYATGVKIAQAAAPSLARLQLELGGKDPTYVSDDVDVGMAAESLADGAMYNTGQSCCSVERIYVHEKIYGAFLERFVSTVKGFAIGEPTDEATYIGPLTRAAQVAVLEKQVADAVQKGAKLLAGGKRMQKPGNWFEPTVLSDVTHQMAVMRDESFGPIIGIQKVRGADEAVALMNDTEYGLTAGVYSRSRDEAESILRRVQSGSVYWNCCDRVSPRLPWSGRRHSGIGSTLSLEGLRAFVQPKAWHLRGHP
jgi:acyl-CoA reductase-like NAD-dependent aldehyde dehydrogenase